MLNKENQIGIDPAIIEDARRALGYLSDDQRELLDRTVAYTLLFIFQGKTASEIVKYFKEEIPGYDKAISALEAIP